MPERERSRRPSRGVTLRSMKRSGEPGMDHAHTTLSPTLSPLSGEVRGPQNKVYREQWQRALSLVFFRHSQLQEPRTTNTSTWLRRGSHAGKWRHTDHDDDCSTGNENTPRRRWGVGGGGMIFQINLGTVAPSCALGQYCTGGQRVQMRSSSH